MHRIGKYFLLFNSINLSSTSMLFFSNILCPLCRYDFSKEFGMLFAENNNNNNNNNNNQDVNNDENDFIQNIINNFNNNINNNANINNINGNSNCLFLLYNYFSFLKNLHLIPKLYFHLI